LRSKRMEDGRVTANDPRGADRGLRQLTVLHSRSELVSHQSA
jgi:hypothetical protein